MTIKANILANYLGAGAVSLAPILALPWYLEALGPIQFGLISFVVTLQAVLGLLDAGVSQALVREITVRLNISKDGHHSAASLLYGFERIYWLFALTAGCATLLLAESIATHWLNLEGASLASGKQAIYGAAFIFASQFPGSVYRSLLVGAQKQVVLNAILLGCTLVRHIGGVVCIVVWPTLMSYLIWHSFAAFLETLLRGRWAWATLNVKRYNAKSDLSELRPIWKSVASLSGVSVLAVLTVQMDKIIISRMASVEQFGYYTIAAMVAGGALQLTYPLFQAAMPHVIQLKDTPVELRKFNLRLFFAIGALCAFCAFVFLVLGRWCLNRWLMNTEAVEIIYPLVVVLLVGSCLNSFYNVGYINWVAHQKIGRMFVVNILSLILSVMLIPNLVSWLGVIGATFGWVAINTLGLLLSLEWLRHK